MGCDFVGKVVSAGKRVPYYEETRQAGEDESTKSIHPGQLRWGFIRGGVTSPSTSTQKGAFAEYVTVPWDLTGVVPRNLSSEQAASIPIPFATAV